MALKVKCLIASFVIILGFGAIPRAQALYDVGTVKIDMNSLRKLCGMSSTCTNIRKSCFEANPGNLTKCDKINGACVDQCVENTLEEMSQGTE